MFKDIKLILAYETVGVQKLIEFRPVSYSSMKNKNVSFGVPCKIKEIVEWKSFKLISVTCPIYDGLNLQHADIGYSVDNKFLLFHFM